MHPPPPAHASPEASAGLPAEAGETPLRWRPMRKTDAALIHRLHLAAGRVDHPHERHERATVASLFAESNFVPRRDGVIAIGPGGTALAYGACVREDDPAPDPFRAIPAHIEVRLEGTVHPRIRGRGVGRALFVWQQHRGRELGARPAPTARTPDHPGFPQLLTAFAHTPGSPAARLYRAAGHTPVRTWLRLRRPLGTTAPASAAPAPSIPVRTLPSGIQLRPFALRYSERTRIAFNDAFRDHWGFTPISRRDWRRQGRDHTFAPGISLLALSGRGTLRDPHQVAGFVLAAVNRKEWVLHGERFSVFDAIGVTRAWRGTGLATPLIAAALRAHEARGFSSVELDVDADNPSGALAMYERLGFAERDRSVSYGLSVERCEGTAPSGPPRTPS
ncbi:GNAT family N-acetyltransferase [Leucobacter chromiireducens subsp. solipictus]